MSEEQTHFGFQQVPVGEKAKRVADVFNSVADNYNIMNDVMSLGVHRIWKRFTLSQTGLKAGQKVLDLAGGTGDLAMKMAGMVGPSGQVVLSDINGSMLRRGRERLTDNGIAGNIEYVQANA